MKIIKIVLFIFVFLLLTITAYGQTNITINASDNNVDVSELIELEINISIDSSNNGGELTIAGLSDFHIIGKSESQSYQSVNGETQNNSVIVLTIKGKKAGEYTIGPIIIDEYESNFVDIVVTGAEVLIGGQGDTEKLNIDPSVSGENNIQKKTQKNTQIQDLSDKSKTFADIMPNSSLFPFHLKYSFIFFLICSILFLVFFVYRYIQKTLNKRNKSFDSQPEKIQVNYYELLEEFNQNHLNSHKDIFYGKLGDIMRQYLDEKIMTGLSTKTLTEVSKKLSSHPSLKKAYELIYYPEYNKQNDTTEERVQLINSLQNELI